MSNEGEHHHDLHDGRNHGDWKSRYDKSAWYQIIVEISYLVCVLAICITLLIDACTTKVEPGLVRSSLFNIEISTDKVKWVALAIAGMIGGIVFDFKWLYHTVAKGTWNRDRILWRFIVPWNSAMVALFTGFLFASGIVPFLKQESFDEVLTLMACGFIFGYFSDNVLAALQNLAQKIFGTLDSEN